MKELPVNEKLIETMFNGMLLRYFGSGISLWTPTTRQERDEGFDTALSIGLPDQNLFLQFKAPYIKETDEFYFNITLHQHHILQARGNGRAYYIAPTFRSFREVRDAQGKDTEGSFNFLRRYIAVNVRSLPVDVQQVLYKRQLWGDNLSNTNKYDPKEPKYRVNDKPNDGSISREGWLRADELLLSFTEGGLPYSGNGNGEECLYRASISEVDFKTRELASDKSSSPGAITFVFWNPTAR